MAHDHQQKIKKLFDKKSSKDDFQLGDIVLNWNAPKQDKGKHVKFEALWIGPFKISETLSNNTYRLQNLEGDRVFSGLANRHFLNFFFV
jgi:hypothetical protein